MSKLATLAAVLVAASVLLTAALQSTRGQRDNEAVSAESTHGASSSAQQEAEQNAPAQESPGTLGERQTVTVEDTWKDQGPLELRVFATHDSKARLRPTDARSAKLIPLEIRNLNFEAQVPDEHQGLAVGPRISPLVLGPGANTVPLEELVQRSPTRIEFPGDETATDETVQLKVEGYFESPSDPTVRLPWRWDAVQLEDGANIPTVEGQVLITASKGTAVGSWQGTMPVDGNRVVVKLHDSLTARGSIAGFPADLDTAATVTVRTVESEVEQILGRAEIRQDGQWSLEGMPRIAGATYLFRIVHPRAVPTQAAAKFPAGIQRIDVALSWTEGLSQQIKVTDSSDRPVPSASVSMQWSDAGAWNRTYTVTDTSGLAWFHNSPEAAAYFRIVGSAYSEETQGPWNVPTHSSQTIPVRALPAASVQGELLPASLASDGFTIAYWTKDRAPSTRTFGPEVKGQFQLHRLRRETLYFSAICPNGASTATSKAFNLEQGSDMVLSLQLEQPRKVAGRVVSHSSGKGIAGATIQSRWVSSHGHVIRDTPASVTCGPGGYFHDLPVPHGPITLLASAEGMAYKSRNFRVQPAPGEALPSIRLKKLGALTVRLTGSTESPTEYRFLYEGISGTETQPFDTHGSVFFPACPPHEYAYVSVETPIGGLIQVFVSMPSAESWDVPIAISTDQTTLADFKRVVSAGFTGPFQIRSTYLDSNGFQVTHTRYAKDPDHTYAFTDLPRGPCTIILFSGTQQVAVKAVDLADAGSDTIFLDPMGERGAIRLTSSEEGYFASAVIHLAPKKMPGHAIAVSKGIEGTLALEKVEPGPAILTVRSDSSPQSLFVADCVVLEDPGSTTEIEVRHDATVRLRTVSAGGEELSLPVFVSHASSPHSRLEVAGMTEQDMQPIRVSPGTYGWRLNAPGYWPEAGWMEAKAGPNTVVIKARRRGAVAIQGPPSTEIVLWSDADNHATTYWADIDGGLANSDTSATGSLELVLPEGPYRAWIAGQGSEAASEFTVVAGGSVAVSVAN